MILKTVKTLSDIESLIAEAMSEKCTDILSVLRLIKSKIVLEEKKSGDPLTEEEIQGVLVSAVKSYKDSIEEYKKANREDLAEKEEKELEIVLKLVPNASFSEDDIITLVNGEIERRKAENGSISMKDMSPIMTVVKAKFPFADGKLVADIVKKNILGK